MAAGASRSSPGPAPIPRREAIELTAYAKEAGAAQRAVGRSLLQQADAGRPLPALPGDRREGRPAADPLQRARPHGRRPRQRDGAAPGAGAGHRRHQGRDRGPRPRQRAPEGAGRRPASATSPSTAATTSRRCRCMLMGGARRDLRHRQRRAGADGARCARPRWPATSPPRAPATTACSACTASSSSRRIRSPSSGRSREMGLHRKRTAAAAGPALAAATTTRSAPRCAKRAAS